VRARRGDGNHGDTGPTDCVHVGRVEEGRTAVSEDDTGR
jgi:hypothetical protein